MTKRFAQVSQLPDDDDRYAGFLFTIAQAWVVPNFTEHGWGLTRAPSEVVQLLQRSLYENMDHAKEESFTTRAIEGKDGHGWERPLFIPQPEINDMVLQALQPMHEQWAGIPLKGSVAYGLRIYRNQTILHLHSKLLDIRQSYEWIRRFVLQFVCIFFFFPHLFFLWSAPTDHWLVGRLSINQRIS